MGTNTENGIWIFGITIRIYSNICFGRSCLCRFKRSFLCPGAGHIRILVYYTRSVSVAEIWSGVSINYLELVSLYMLNCLLATCYSRRRPSVYKLNSEASMLPVRRDISIKVSTVSWKPKAVVIKRFVVRHKSGIFVHNYFPTDSKILRLHSHDKLIPYTNDLFKITLQHADKFDRYSVTIVQCFIGSDTKYCHSLNFGTRNLMCYRNQGFDRQ